MEPAAPPLKPHLRGAVLCYPGDMSISAAYRAMRQLTTRLTSAGFHTLRFDYFGSGDSMAMTATDTDLTGWECDAALAVDEIQEIVGHAKITLIGPPTLARSYGAFGGTTQ